MDQNEGQKCYADYQKEAVKASKWTENLIKRPENLVFPQ